MNLSYQFKNTLEESTLNHDIPMGKSHLSIKNLDNIDTYEIWAQSEECYTCSSWKYLSLKPSEESSLIMNSTYSTNIFLRLPYKLQVVHSYKFHFVQRGDYSLEFNSSHFPPIVTHHQGDNEYIAIFGAFLFFLVVNLFWCGIKTLTKKMDEDNQYQRGILRNETNRMASGSSEGTEPLIASGTRPAASTETLASIPDPAASSRLLCLDVFRGISIVIMIFVNYGGGSYFFFQHSIWNGLTVADLAFPWFLWIMGVSLTFSIRSQLRRMVPYSVIGLKIIRRSITLFMLGLVINSIRSNFLPQFRIFGVLQRFAFCYLINALLEAFRMKPQESTEYFRCWWLRDIKWSWVQWAAVGSLVFAHTAVVFLLPVPGCPKSYIGPGGIHEWGKYPNCSGGATMYVDHLVLGQDHLYAHNSFGRIYDSHVKFDPEGILGILTSCLSVQLGVAAGRVILYFPNHSQRLRRFLVWGIVTGAVGGVLCGWSKEFGLIPLNKRLWSLSYVCVTSSFAFLLLAAIYYVTDVKKWWEGSTFRVAGLNPILLYVGHELTKKLFPWSWTPVPPFNSNHLFMSVWGTCLWLVIAFVCHHKKLYISV